MKPINKPASTTTTPYSNRALSDLLSHSDDAFYGSLQRVWNRISAVLFQNEEARTHLLPNPPGRTKVWRMANQRVRIKRHQASVSGLEALSVHHKTVSSAYRNGKRVSYSLSYWSLKLNPMIRSREVYFQGGSPSVQDIITQVKRMTGIEATYDIDKWLLVNPLRREDHFNLYPEGAHIVTVTNEEPTSDLLHATLNALVEMGGYVRL